MVGSGWVMPGMSKPTAQPQGDQLPQLSVLISFRTLVFRFISWIRNDTNAHTHIYIYTYTYAHQYCGDMFHEVHSWITPDTAFHRFPGGFPGAPWPTWPSPPAPLRVTTARFTRGASGAAQRSRRSWSWPRWISCCHCCCCPSQPVTWWNDVG